MSGSPPEPPAAFNPITNQQREVVVSNTASATKAQAERNTAPRPVFIIRLQPTPGNTRTRAIHDLRLLLKTLLRQHGLQCLDIREEGGDA